MANQATATGASCCGPTCCTPQPISESEAPFGDFQVRAANDLDHDAVSALLSASRLATLDSSSQFGPHHVVANDSEGRLVGVAGVEVHESDALLRSVAVAPSFRSQGLGRQLTQDRLRWAAEHQISTVYLLTTDASSYWRRHGFSEIGRDDAPSSIRSTSQWSGGCSSSAIAMKRKVADNVPEQTERRSGMSNLVIDSVKEKYGAVARSRLSSNDSGVKAVAEAFGYTREELTSIPAEANMGLSCGNPTAIAHLKPGEVVVDLGSGGGLDIFLASGKVGPEGRAIGIDMTPAMIERARANAKSGGYTNVEFHLAAIDALPLPESSVDCVISNCVINLAPDKPAVFREIFRVLKPGGRLAVSDIALKQDLPPAVAENLAAYVGCIAGAIKIEDYREGLCAAGFEHVEIVDSRADLNAYAKVENQAGCCAPSMDTRVELSVLADACCSLAAPPPTSLHEDLSKLLSQFDVNKAAASVKVYAITSGQS